MFEPFSGVEAISGRCSCGSRKLKISGLPRDETEGSLRNVLQYFGDMECEIQPLYKSALVTYYDLRAAKRCLMELRRIPSMVHVRVDAVPTKDAGVALAIPIPNISYEQVKYHLAAFGPIFKLEIEHKLVATTQATCIYWDSRSAITACSQYISMGVHKIRPRLIQLFHSQTCWEQQNELEPRELRGLANDGSPPALTSDYAADHFLGLGSSGNGPYSETCWTTAASDRTSGVSLSSLHASASPLVIPTFSPASSVSSSQTASEFNTCRYLLKRYIKAQEKLCELPTALPTAPQRTVSSNLGLTQEMLTQSNAQTKEQLAAKSHESNYIDLKAIDMGIERRTTVMLRNIPNKVDQKALKTFLDETNAFTYDFLYLRIDFGNKCNVGYAFISFTDPKHIKSFVSARRGSKWSHYNSEKVIDVSFANYQGRENLIKKFRNSPIMDADPAYRPKLYYTSGPLIGTEEPFPPPTAEDD